MAFRTSVLDGWPELISPQLHVQARHADHPNAFCRQRKLPLQSLVAAMFGGMRNSVSAELDELFGHLKQQVTGVALHGLFHVHDRNPPGQETRSPPFSCWQIQD